MRATIAAIRDIRLFWKILLPFLALMVIVGSVGAFLIVNDQASRAQGVLDQDLAQRALQARSLLHDRELYLVESANFAANLQGMSDAVRARDSQATARLLQSVQALKTNLDLVVVADARGVGVSELIKPSPDQAAAHGTGSQWSANKFVRDAQASGGTSAGFLILGGRGMMAMATPICSATQECKPVGVAIVATSATRLTTEAASGAAVGTGARESVVLFDLTGHNLAGTTRHGGGVPTDVGRGQMVRRTGSSGSNPLATVYAPFSLQGKTAGTVAVTVSAGPVMASVQGVAWRLALILLAAMAGIVAIGALLSRFLLGQVEPLLVANRALGSGQLSARVRVVSHDELGELAEGVNQMAEQLQAAYETLELRVDERTQEVRRLMRERTEFFAGLSHELRTPLAIVIAQAEMLLDGANKVDRALAVEVAQTVRESATQLLSRVNDILQYARAEAGGVELELRSVQIAAAVKEITPMIQGLAQRAGLKTRIQFPADLPPVRADPARLREVLMNLVDNAVKYTAAGGSVTIGAETVGTEVQVSVSDTGVGIPADEGDRVFEPFHRVKGTSTQSGQASSGLGLALAKTWITAQGGQIGYQSTSGEGTTFTFTLPAMRLTAVTPAPPRQARPTRAPNAVKASRSKRSNANSGRQNNIEELAVTTQV